MMLSTKNITLKTSNNKPSVIVSSKVNLSNSINTKITLKNNSNTKSLSIKNQIKSLTVLSFVKNLNVKAYNFKPPGILAPDPTTGDITFTQRIPQRNSFFSIALDISKIRNSSGDLVDYTEIGLEVFLQNSIYKNIDDETPLFYVDENEYANMLVQVKTNRAKIYWPIYNFNDIKTLDKFEAYNITVKHNNELFLKYSGVAYEAINTISDLNMSFNNAWYLIGTGRSSKIDAIEFFQPLLDEDKIHIIKDYKGGAILPQFNYNGVGDLMPGEGYQVKFKNM